MPRLKPLVLDTIANYATRYLGGGPHGLGQFKRWLGVLIDGSSIEELFENVPASSGLGTMQHHEPRMFESGKGYNISEPKLIRTSSGRLYPAQLMDKGGTGLPPISRPKHWRLLCKDIGTLWGAGQYLEMGEVSGWYDLPDAPPQSSSGNTSYSYEFVNSAEPRNASGLWYSADEVLRRYRESQRNGFPAQPGIPTPAPSVWFDELNNYAAADVGAVGRLNDQIVNGAVTNSAGSLQGHPVPAWEPGHIYPRDPDYTWYSVDPPPAPRAAEYIDPDRLRNAVQPFAYAGLTPQSVSQPVIGQWADFGQTTNRQGEDDGPF